MGKKKRRDARAYRPGRRDRRRRQRSRLYLFIVPAVVVVLAAGGYLAVRGRGASDAAPAGGPQGATAGAATGTPALTVTPPVYDMGQVSQAAGRATFRLAVANTGTGDLVVREMETSCGCTRAALVVDGRTGPWFGMRGHGGVWPTGWSQRLTPGQQGTLLVEYDPDAHGIYRGPIDRAILIYSTDPRQPRAMVRITGTQVP